MNSSLNEHPGLSACMDAVAEKVSIGDIPPTLVLNCKQVIRDSINDLNQKASQQALPIHLSSELHTLVVLSTHRVAKARDIAFKYFNRLITSFPSLMCDPVLVFVILEILTLLQRSCENEHIDEVRDILSES